MKPPFTVTFAPCESCHTYTIAGPRRRGEGVENEEQGIISAEQGQSG